MDAFYASVEQRDDARLRGKPVIVAWKGNRLVVCTASYEARAFGVRSAMPAKRAERLCPEGIFIAPNFNRYRAVLNPKSQQIHLLSFFWCHGIIAKTTSILWAYYFPFSATVNIFLISIVKTFVSANTSSFPNGLCGLALLEIFVSSCFVNRTILFTGQPPIEQGCDGDTSMDATI
jgi:hypothetical protein